METPVVVSPEDASKKAVTKSISTPSYKNSGVALKRATRSHKMAIRKYTSFCENDRCPGALHASVRHTPINTQMMIDTKKTSRQAPSSTIESYKRGISIKHDIPQRIIPIEKKTVLTFMLTR
jgi:hypothetical protein